ncbi:Transcriptional regulator TrmB [sediment metagenome]|uniref:Transcriptional regulator TrmB n=1 Tax=sediment metagenome TaxID=749907 RepID=D9PH51_9ZZZZ
MNMSKNSDKNLIDNLESLGLNQKESLVYIDLLGKSVPVGSSKIVKSTGLHGQFVYDALYSLEEKGLVKHSVFKSRKKFEATALHRINDLIEEKRLVAEKTVEMLKVISKKPLGQEFEVYQGEAAYIQHQFEMLEKMSEGGEILIISTDWGELFTDKKYAFFSKYEKLRQEKNISIRFILNEGLREISQKAKKARYGTAYRFLPEHQSYSGMCVFEDLVDFYLIGSPIIVFAFKDEKISQGYRNFFEVLWGLAKE